ncbi:hypothetical protein WA026_000264 [Henosepilachna vigintioctopunctata]|uniref:DUF4200 domain-containing protein n=1 Tax=Henosepilachna vigintioctopunctata TaxID=420089 RepID=A0AAW1V587_9CUCU
MPKRINRLKLPPLKPVEKNVLLEITGEQPLKSLGEPKDYVRLTPEVDYIIEQNKTQWIKKQWRKKRQQTESCVKELVHQWRILEQKELLFQRTIVAHNRFVRRNLEKRERALLKIQNDTELIKKRTRDIKTLSLKYAVLKDALTKMRDEIVKHSIYEKFLDLVMREIDCPFKMLFEFLTKFEVLLEVKEFCMQRQNHQMSVTIQMQDSSMQHFRHQQIVFIGIRNEVNKLSERYDETVRRNIASEALLCRVITKTNDLNNEVKSCQHTIDTIYRYICHRRGIPPGSLTLSQIEPKVDVIKHTLEGYAKLMPAMRRKSKTKRDRKSQTSNRLSTSKSERASYEREADKRHSSLVNPYFENDAFSQFTYPENW